MKDIDDDRTLDLIQHIEQLPETKTQVVGYVRVSSEDQKFDRQLDGINLDKVFSEKISGGRRDRPELNRLIDYVREGDTVVVHSLDRLARDLGNLIEIAKRLNDKGVVLKSLKEGLVFNVNSQNPMDKFLFHVMGAVAEFNRSLIREAQREGIERAKKRGVYKGRQPKLNPAQLARLREIVLEKNASLDNHKRIKWSDVALEFGVSEPTLFRYIKQVKLSLAQ